jgi:RarD protein
MSLPYAPQRAPDAVQVGLIAAVAAHAFWGFMPLYIHALAFADALEVLAQRILWSTPAAAVVILVLDGWRKGAADVRAALRPKVLAPLALSAVFIAGNWGFYIWAVDHGQVLAAALAYFLSPIVQMLAGVAFFGERLRRWQAAALALTALAVLSQAIALGALPWLSLILCLTWVGYGLVRKQAAVPATAGFLVETLVLAAGAGRALLRLAACAPGDYTKRRGRGAAGVGGADHRFAVDFVFRRGAPHPADHDGCAAVHHAKHAILVRRRVGRAGDGDALGQLRFDLGGAGRVQLGFACVRPRRQANKPARRAAIAISVHAAAGQKGKAPNISASNPALHTKASPYCSHRVVSPRARRSAPSARSGVS